MSDSEKYVQQRVLSSVNVLSFESCEIILFKTFDDIEKHASLNLPV
jgi:hypothetical protein